MLDQIKKLLTDMAHLAKVSKVAMGIDYGTKKTGIAITDTLLISAFPIAIIKTKNIDLLIKNIKELINKYNIGLIVLGMPNSAHYDNKIYQEFFNLLKQETSLPVYCQDEYYTTKTANLILSDAGFKPKKAELRDDQIAAKLILDDFLQKWQYLKNK